MKNYQDCKKFYLGTFAYVELPSKIQSYPSCMIVNNQQKNKPREHWVAIYFDKSKRATFFDSYGQCKRLQFRSIFTKQFYKL